MVMPTNLINIGRQLEVVESGDKAVLAAGGDVNLFTITGGPIYLYELVGLVTTALTATTTMIMHLQNTATDMCLAVAGLDCVSVVGTYLTIDGVMGNAMVETTIADGITTVMSFTANHQILSVGTVMMVTVDTSADTGSAGAVNWTLVYRPMRRESYVVAV